MLFLKVVLAQILKPSVINIVHNIMVIIFNLVVFKLIIRKLHELIYNGDDKTTKFSRIVNGM